jgi:hypothetical protein
VIGGKSCDASRPKTGTHCFDDGTSKGKDDGCYRAEGDDANGTRGRRDQTVSGPSQQVQRAVKVNVPGKRQAGCGAAAGARMGDEVVQEGAGALRHQGVLSWTRGDAGMSSGRCRVYWHMALSPSAWDFCHQTCVV